MDDIIDTFCQSHGIPLEFITVQFGQRPTQLFIKCRHYGWSVTLYTTLLTQTIYDLNYNPIQCVIHPSQSTLHPHPQDLALYVPLATLHAIQQRLHPIPPLQIQPLPPHYAMDYTNKHGPAALIIHFDDINLAWSPNTPTTCSPH